MLKGTGSGSLYGAVDVLGKPTNTKGRKGIIPNYRLISKIRLNAPKSKKRYRLVTGGAQVRSGVVDPPGPQPRQHDRPDRRHLLASPAPPAATAPPRPSPPSRASSSASTSAPPRA